MIIFLDVDPPTAWGKNNKQISKSGNGRPFLRKSDSIKSTEELLKILISSKKPKTPMDGALKLNIMVCFPYKKTEKVSVIESGSLIPKITAPDSDAIETTIMDVLERSGFVVNDSRFYCVHTEKWYGPKGFIRIEITKYEDKNETK